MSKIRVILIDATNKQVKELEIEDSLAEYYKLINCELVEAVYPAGLADGHFLYVDEEGAFTKRNFRFLIKGFPYPLLGNAILLCSNAEGESISCTMSVKEIEDMVVFPR